MSDQPADTAQKVQHAALGAIDALRHLLDAAEEVVADPRHLQDVVAGVSDWAEKVSSTFGGGAGGAERPTGQAEDEANDADAGGDGPDEPGSGRLRRVPLD